MKQIKMWFGRMYRRAKKWVLAILVSLGLIAGGLAYAESKDISWVNATQRVDGTVLLVSEIASTNLYCDGDSTPVLVVTDGRTSVVLDFGIGFHNCYATHIDTNGQESAQSNVISFTILPAAPKPPVITIT